MAWLLCLLLCVFPVLVGAQAPNAQLLQPNFPYYQQQQEQVSFGIGARPWMFTGKFTIKQDGLADINLNEVLSLPKDFTAGQLSLIAGQRPLLISYEYTPSIRASGSNTLPATLYIGNTQFGPVTTQGTAAKNDPVFLEAQTSKHRIEFAYTLDLAPNTLLAPRISASFYPLKISAHTADNKLSDSYGTTASVFSIGAAFEERFNFLIVTLGADYKFGKGASGYDADLTATLVPSSRRYPIYLSAGYRIEQTSFRFNGGSVDTDLRGPFLKAQLRY